MSDWLDPAKDTKADNGHVTSESPSVDQPAVTPKPDNPQPVHRDSRNRGWHLGKNKK